MITFVLLCHLIFHSTFMKVMELRYCCNEYPNLSKSPSSPPQACPQLNRIILSSTQSKVFIILYQANNTGEGWHQILNRVLRLCLI